LAIIVWYLEEFMKNLILIAVLAIPTFASASPYSSFLTCTSKTYTFVVIPKVETDVNMPYFEGVYFRGALVSYARTDGKSVQTLSTGQKVWSRNGAFRITIDAIADLNKDVRRQFTIQDADGETEKFPTEKGTCTGYLESNIPE
jgi:hypothetical protein